MQRSAIETVMGAVVLVAAVGFFGFAYQVSGAIGPDASDGYELTANFTQIGGLTVGSSVLVGGVPVGTITATNLNTETYLAEVTMMISDDILLPLDTTAMIESESLLGGRILSLVPGGEFDMLEPGDQIVFTQSVPSLEQLLGQVVHSIQSGN